MTGTSPTAPTSTLAPATTSPGAGLYISGRVWADTNGDGVGDAVLPGVKLYLNDSNGDTVFTQLSDDQGLYEFFNVPPGKYRVIQSLLPGYTIVSDTEGDPQDNMISVDLTNGKASYGNDFIDAPPFLQPVTEAPQGNLYVSGRVWADTNGDGVGDQVLPGVKIQLTDESGSNVAVQTTDVQGLYEFFNLTAGKYRVNQTNLPGYTEVADSDGDQHDNTVSVDLTNGKSSYGNDFVDQPPPNVVPATNAPGTLLYIAGRVWADTDGDGVGDQVLHGVQVNLNDMNGNTLSIQSTDDQGLYEFFNVTAGKYQVNETNLPGYTDVSDTQGNTLDNIIVVDLTTGKSSYDNDFVDAPPANTAQVSQQYKCQDRRAAWKCFWSSLGRHQWRWCW